MGKKKQPTYRMVAADSRSPRDGRFLEIVGTYAPRGKSTTERDMVLTVDNAKAVKWLSQGAKPTERVERLLRASGAWDEFTSPGSTPKAAAPAQSTAAAEEPPAPPSEPAQATAETSEAPAEDAATTETDESAETPEASA
jgi:small subunit ribosomal protein S16